jgi:hypothetical protein
MEKFRICTGVAAVAADGCGIFSDYFIEVKFLNYGLANLAACGNIFFVERRRKIPQEVATSCCTRCASKRIFRRKQRILL